MNRFTLWLKFVPSGTKKKKEKLKGEGRRRCEKNRDSNTQGKEAGVQKRERTQKISFHCEDLITVYNTLSIC